MTIGPGLHIRGATSGMGRDGIGGGRGREMWRGQASARRGFKGGTATAKITDNHPSSLGVEKNARGGVGPQHHRFIRERGGNKQGYGEDQQGGENDSTSYYASHKSMQRARKRWWRQHYAEALAVEVASSWMAPIVSSDADTSFRSGRASHHRQAQHVSSAAAVRGTTSMASGRGIPTNATMTTQTQTAEEVGVSSECRYGDSRALARSPFNASVMGIQIRLNIGKAELKLSAAPHGVAVVRASSVISDIISGRTSITAWNHKTRGKDFASLGVGKIQFRILGIDDRKLPTSAATTESSQSPSTPSPSSSARDKTRRDAWKRGTEQSASTPLHSPQSIIEDQPIAAAFNGVNITYAHRHHQFYNGFSLPNIESHPSIAYRTSNDTMGVDESTKEGLSRLQHRTSLQSQFHQTPPPPMVTEEAKIRPLPAKTPLPAPDSRAQASGLEVDNGNLFSGGEYRFCLLFFSLSLLSALISSLYLIAIFNFVSI